MDSHTLLALYDQELRIDIDYPGAWKEVSPHVVRFVRPAPGMNFILYSRLDETNADAVIQEQVAYFSRMDQPFSWKVYDHDTPPDLKDRLAAHGFACDEPSPVLILDVREAPPGLLAPVAADVRPVAHRDQLDAVVAIEEQVWGGSFGWLKQRLGDHLAIPDYLSVYVAYVDGQPACAGWAYFHPNSQFASLFGGSTLPAYRKQGLYTAVLAIRVQEAIQRGYRYLVIEPTEMSRPIVARHGFRLLTVAYDYEWKGRRF